MFKAALVMAVVPLCALSALACSRAEQPAAPAALSAVTSSGAAAVPADASDASADAAVEDDGAPVTEAQKAAFIDAMIPLLEAHYLFPDIGTKMIAALREHAARGDYAGLHGGRAFAKAVTRDLRAVSHDVHVLLRYSGGPENAPSQAERDAEAALAASSGFVTVDRLPGNVALLRIDAFDQLPTPKGAVEAAYAARMTQINDASALILDLRENYGGYPETVALLLSYFFDTAVHLNDFWDRVESKTYPSWTRAQVSGPRFGAKKPIFVLTGKQTMSGGEEAAYDLQSMKRAVVVGGSTAGGANYAPRHKLDEHFTFCVPQGRPINPVTHMNWEGTGVAPDVVVDPKAALREAHVRALGALIASAPAGQRRSELEKVLAQVRDADAGPVP